MDNEEILVLSESEASKEALVVYECQCADCNCVDGDCCTDY